MANKYFVLATGNNNWSSTGTWSANSNGTPTGASVPTSADNVYPSSSIATGATLTIDSTANCLNMDWSGVISSPIFNVSNGVNVYGTVIKFYNAMSMVGSAIISPQSASNCVVTTNGMVLSCGFEPHFNSLADNFSTTGSITPDLSGTFNTNGFTVNCLNFNDGGYASGRTLTLGSSTINCSGYFRWTAGNTITANTSTINCSGNFSGGGITTYNIVNLTGATSTISDSNTFAQLNLTPAVTQTFKFTDGSNQTVTTANLSGTLGHIHTLTGTSTGGWTITKAGGGTIALKYVDVSYSTGNPVSTWSASVSKDSGYNTNWTIIKTIKNLLRAMKALNYWI
jgi:hypothetical protein